MLRNLTIKTRLGLNLFLLCALLIAAGGLGVYGTMVNHSVSERLVAGEALVTARCVFSKTMTCLAGCGYR